MEILSGAGGGVLALFHHLFSVALVILVADLAVSALPHLFYGAVKIGRKSAQFDKIETLQNRF